MSGIQQNFAYGRFFGFPNSWPVANIGDAYGGGFFAGQINVSGTKYNLVVAPKSTGESSSKTWGPSGVTTGVTSPINGPTNTTSLVALGTSYQAATFCNNLNNGGGLNGYTDWYLPATNELEVLYYYLKPTTYDNYNTNGSGANVNSVLPEPYNTAYAIGSPTQTNAVGFKTGETNAFASSLYWTSSELNSDSAYLQYFVTGHQDYIFTTKPINWYVRAVRRVLA